jgi:hypothetical protein
LSQKAKIFAEFFGKKNKKSVPGWIVLERMRVPGVLQRFGITYLIVTSTAFLFSGRNSKKEAVSQLWRAGVNSPVSRRGDFG